MTEHGNEAMLKAMDDLDRATSIVKTVWLALMSNTFDACDQGDVGNTLYEALERLHKVTETVGEANARDIREHVGRGTP
jgi:hypothetical protein